MLGNQCVLAALELFGVEGLEPGLVDHHFGEIHEDAFP
jgi:hypothetical protein